VAFFTDARLWISARLGEIHRALDRLWLRDMYTSKDRDRDRNFNLQFHGVWNILLNADCPYVGNFRTAVKPKIFEEHWASGSWLEGEISVANGKKEGLSESTELAPLVKPSDWPSDSLETLIRDLKTYKYKFNRKKYICHWKLCYKRIQFYNIWITCNLEFVFANKGSERTPEVRISMV
jgi:hypothetical protein